MKPPLPSQAHQPRLTRWAAVLLCCMAAGCTMAQRQPDAGAPTTTPRPAGAAVFATPPQACMREGESCGAANQVCCGNLVCVGVQNSFCTLTP